jgi:hypothetical protein
MTLRPLLYASTAALALLVVGTALAQDPSGVSSEIERTATTSPEEKIAYAEASNEEIAEAEKQIARMLDQARKDGDAEAIECLISRLTSVRALQQVALKAQTSMADALAAGEEEKANHEFRKIAVAVSKTRMLLAEAQRCASEQALESGDTLVDWETSLVDDDDPIDEDIEDDDLYPDPPEVSPFL